MIAVFIMINPMAVSDTPVQLQLPVSDY